MIRKKVLRRFRYLVHLFSQIIHFSLNAKQYYGPLIIPVFPKGLIQSIHS
jgi:hypothetical protein